MKKANLILFGFKGCGKSQTGKLLAKMMHRPFIDTDDLISDLHTRKLRDRSEIKFSVCEEKNGLDLEDFPTAGIASNTCKGKSSRDESNFPSETLKVIFERSLTPREIYKEMGERLFRALERKALLTLENVQNSIIALGGGAVLDPDNVAFLQKIGLLVYLKAKPKPLREIPAFIDKSDPTASYLKIYQDRLPIYESIPAHCIDLDQLDEASVLAALRDLLITPRVNI